jgi:hypothetical protein
MAYRQTFFDTRTGKPVAAAPASRASAAIRSGDGRRIKNDAHVVIDTTTDRPVLDLSSIPTIAAASFTREGVTTASIEGRKLSLYRFNYHLDRAPSVLPDLAEALAQVKLNDAGQMETHIVPVRDFPKFAQRLNEGDAPTFANWLAWLLSPRDGGRPIAPDTATTLAEFVQRCIDAPSNRVREDQLHSAHLHSVGNAELLARIAAARKAMRAEQ